MKPIYRYWVATLVLAAGVVTAAQAFADPPARVARLNYVKGSVSFRPASLDDWAPATLNYPLTTGDHLWTDDSSWAEMHIGSSAIRLAPSTAFAFLTLDDRTTQIRLSEGAVDVRVRNLDGSEEFEIDTPSAAIALTRPGVYRVDVLPDGGSTRVTVRFGVASVTADGPDFSVRDGETAAIYGTEQVSHEVFRAAAPDNWEQWCRTRDEHEDRAASVRYVSYEMTGYEDLDDYGTWSSIPDYGWAWRPRVAYGWSPYRYGQWRWVSPWGWTWVDEAAWGFAPFHYGRWACLRGSWYWVPGAYAVRPIYSPALVAFIGGDRWGLSVGFGRSHVGWFPLAPGEFWMPYYHASHNYIRNLNVTNVNIRNININNYDVSRGTYVNRAIAGGVTAVPRDSFLGGRAVARDAVALDARATMRADVIGTSAPLAPRAESVVGRRGGYAARPPNTVMDRAVVARSQPAAAAVPFGAQERAIQANGGRPLDDAAVARLRSQTGVRGSDTPVRIAGARGGGLRGDPARGEAVRGDRDAVRGDQPGTRPGAGSYGAGIATRRSGERVTPESGRPSAQPVPGATRPEGNDRPGWARPRGGEVQPTNPRDSGGDRAGTRSRPGAAGDDRLTPRGSGAGLPADRPGGSGQGEARSRDGERSSQPAPNERPSLGRPSGGENARPAQGARPRGGEARPAPQSKPSGETAKPRSGGRGGDSSYAPSSSRLDSNDRPPAARSWSGAVAAGARSVGESPRTYGGSPEMARPRWSDRVVTPESARPAPQYRAVPDARPTPQYRAMPESRPAPQYRAMPESRPAPQYRAMPESRPAPQYRAMPDSRPAPQYRAMPESRPAPPVRSYGSAVERGGGGARQQAAPAPRQQPPSGGQAAPRGGARNRGRGE